MTAWCATTGAERIFKLGKIVKATDVRNGARINVGRLMDKPRLTASPSHSSSSEADHAASGASQIADASGWWSASRLGLH
jgi:hypothetical protein